MQVWAWTKPLGPRPWSRPGTMIQTKFGDTSKYHQGDSSLFDFSADKRNLRIFLQYPRDRLSFIHSVPGKLCQISRWLIRTCKNMITLTICCRVPFYLLRKTHPIPICQCFDDFVKALDLWTTVNKVLPRVTPRWNTRKKVLSLCPLAECLSFQLTAFTILLDLRLCGTTSALTNIQCIMWPCLVYMDMQTWTPRQ